MQTVITTKAPIAGSGATRMWSPTSGSTGMRASLPIMGTMGGWSTTPTVGSSNPHPATGLNYHQITIPTLCGILKTGPPEQTVPFSFLAFKMPHFPALKPYRYTLMLLFQNIFVTKKRELYLQILDLYAFCFDTHLVRAVSKSLFKNVANSM